MARKGGVCATCGMPNDENHPRETREFNGQKMVVNVHPCKEHTLTDVVYVNGVRTERCHRCGKVME